MSAAPKFQSISDTTDAPLGRGIKRFTIKANAGTTQEQIETLGYFTKFDIRSWQAGDLIHVITDDKSLLYEIVGNSNPDRYIEVSFIPLESAAALVVAADVPATAGGSGTPTEAKTNVQTQLDALNGSIAGLGGGGGLVAENNLSDLDNAATARTNLGLANLATQTGSNFFLTLPALADAAAFRAEIGAGTGNGDLLAANNLSDVANAGTARTNLGLGALALLGSINNSNWTGTALSIPNGGTGATSAGGALTALGALPAANYTSADVITKFLAGDGPGSLTNADLLDGYEASELAKLAGDQTFTDGSSAFRILENAGAGNTAELRITSGAGNDAAIYFGDADDVVRGGFFYDRSANALLIRGYNNSTRLTIDSSGNAEFSGPLSAASIKAPPAISSETSGTLTVASANKTIFAAGGITLPNSVFSAGDMIVIEANGSARTITRGSGVTMYVNGANAASATLAANSAMGVIWRTPSFCTLTGAVS